MLYTSKSNGWKELLLIDYAIYGIRNNETYYIGIFVCKILLGFGWISIQWHFIGLFTIWSLANFSFITWWDKKTLLIKDIKLLKLNYY